MRDVGWVFIVSSAEGKLYPPGGVFFLVDLCVCGGHSRFRWVESGSKAFLFLYVWNMYTSRHINSNCWKREKSCSAFSLFSAAVPCFICMCIAPHTHTQQLPPSLTHTLSHVCHISFEMKSWSLIVLVLVLVIVLFCASVFRLDVCIWIFFLVMKGLV